MLSSVSCPPPPPSLPPSLPPVASPQIPQQRSAYYLPDQEAEKVKRKRQAKLARLQSGATSAGTLGDVPAGPSGAPRLERVSTGLGGSDYSRTVSLQERGSLDRGTLERPSPGAASSASRSSGAGSAAGAELLRPARMDSGAGSAGEQEEARRPLKKRIKKWLVRFIVKPLIGFDPSLQGEWVPPHGYDVRSVGAPRLLPLLLRLPLLATGHRGGLAERNWRPCCLAAG